MNPGAGLWRQSDCPLVMDAGLLRLFRKGGDKGEINRDINVFDFYSRAIVKSAHGKRGFLILPDQLDCRKTRRGGNMPSDLMSQFGRNERRISELAATP